MTELSGLQIFKYLPGSKKAEHTNCKACGCATCMAFALKLAKKQIDVTNCPYASAKLKEKIALHLKDPQKTIEICGVKIGGENVLYRHEKTFVNRTAVGIVIDTAKSGWEEQLQRVENFEITRIDEKLKVDFVVLKNADNEIMHKAGKYNNIITLEEIKQNDYVLTPGRYVGVAEQEEDDEAFAAKMARLTAELTAQMEESAKLDAKIKENLAKLGK